MRRPLPKYLQVMDMLPECLGSGTWVTTTLFVHRTEVFMKWLSMVVVVFLKDLTIGGMTILTTHMNTMENLKNMKGTAQMCSLKMPLILLRRTRKIPSYVTFQQMHHMVR